MSQRALRGRVEWTPHKLSDRHGLPDTYLFMAKYVEWYRPRTMQPSALPAWLSALDADTDEDVGSALSDDEPAPTLVAKSRRTASTADEPMPGLVVAPAGPDGMHT